MQSKRGFSLLELLIYIALISILSVSLVNVFISVNKGAGNNTARTAVDSNLRFAFEKIEQDIHSASAVVTPASAGATSTSLVLSINGNTTTYSVVGGQLQRQVNVLTPDTITDATVVVNTTTIPLVFARFENNNAVFASSSASVQIQMNIRYGGTSPDMQYNETKKTTVLMRQFH